MGLLSEPPGAATAVDSPPDTDAAIDESPATDAAVDESPAAAAAVDESPAAAAAVDSLPDTIAAIDEMMPQLLGQLAKTYGDETECYPFLVADEEISSATVDRVFDDLQRCYGIMAESRSLVILVDSGGGNIDAAYNLALLFRRYGSEHLRYIVPRWAKSAATLLVCGGDSVAMTPVAELGPLDPQITEVNPMEQRLERFSPLHIESTLELIRNEFAQGNKELADGLLQRLQFPITLGSFKKTLEVGKQYAEKLLASRMLREDPAKATSVASRLVEEYANHGFCINVDEASSLGLVVEELSESQLELVWTIHKLTRKKTALLEEERRKAIGDLLKELPPGLLDRLPPGILTQDLKTNPTE